MVDKKYLKDINLHIDAVHAQSPNSDQYTGEIVQAVVDRVNCSGIIATISRTVMDINRPINNQNTPAIGEFRNTIKEIIESNDMTDKLTYKDFIDTVHFSTKDSVFYGKIGGINDLVTFEGESVKNLKSAFKEAVDDYIYLCNENGKTPLKSFKGSFNVRIEPKLHFKAFKLAKIHGKSLNQFVSDAIKKEVASLYNNRDSYRRLR